MLVQVSIFFIFPTTEAYDAALDHISNDPKLKKELGDIKHIRLIPIGVVNIHTINDVESGNATFRFIVKGTKKFKDVMLELEELPGADWKVLNTQE